MVSVPTDPRPDRSEIGTGQLIAIAAAACGGAAWLFQKLTSDEEKEPATTEPIPANLRTHLHALVESEPVRAAERRGDALAPVVRGYRKRAGRLAETANAEGTKRLVEAERQLARRRKQTAAVGHDVEKQVGHQADRVRQLVGDVTDRVTSAIDDGRTELRHVERSAGKRAGQLRKTTTGRTGEVTTMANEHVRRLQERGHEAAESISSTLRDNSKDTASRVADVREQVVSLAKTSSKDVGALIHDVREDARKNLPDVARTVTDRAADLGHQVADGATRAGHVIGERASQAGDRVPGGSDTASRAQSTITDVTQKAAALAAPALGKVGDRLGHLSDDVRDDPSGVRDRLVEQGQGALKTIQSQVSRSSKDAPDIGSKVEILQGRAAEARDRGLDLTALLQSNIPSFLAQVTDLIEQAGDKSGDRVKEARKQGAEVVGSAEDQVQSAIDRLSEAARRAAQVGDQAVAASSHFRGASRNAAHKTADAGKDGFESIIWLGAAGVAMYYGILSPEQRATVNKYGRKAGRGLGKVIGEIRGQDQKF